MELVCHAMIRGTFQPIIWVDARSKTAVVRQFERIAAEILVPGATLADAQTNIKFVLRTLCESKKPLLFVFDNFGTSVNVGNLAPFLPQRRTFSVLYIRAYSDPSFPGTSIMLPPMSVEHAVLLLLEQSVHKADRISTIRGQRIVRRLGCLPLAVIRVGSWLHSSKVPLEQFASRFDLYVPYVFSDSGPLNVFIRKTSRTWTMAMKAFYSDPSARNDMVHMLLFCCVLHKDIIDGHFARSLWRDPGDVPRWATRFITNGTWSDPRFGAAIQELGGFAILNIVHWQDQHCHFSVHPIVRQWLKTRVKAPVLVDMVLYVMNLVAGVNDCSSGDSTGLDRQNQIRLYVSSSLQSLTELQETEEFSSLLVPHERVILDVKYRFAGLISNTADLFGNTIRQIYQL